MNKFKLIGYLGFVFLFTLSIDIHAQKSLEEKADVNFKEENYVLALKQYIKLYKKNKMSMKYNHRIGQCFLRTNLNKSKAIQFLQYVTNQEDSPAEAYFELGLARMHAHQFPFAKLTFKEYIRNSGRDKDAEKKAKRHIKMCNRAVEMKSNPVDVSFENLGENINTPANETHPFISADESFMAFCSDREYYTSNIFTTHYNRKKNKWEKAQKTSSSVNTISNDLLAGIASNGNKLLTHNANKKMNRNLYHTIGDKNQLQGVRKYKLNVNAKEGKQAGADISYSGDTLFFASNRPGGYGGYDIYMCLRMPNGEWGVPQNLGDVVNTPYDENYPNIMKDGRTLYFSSNGHSTMGGYDLFKTVYSNEMYAWKQPKNLGYPINDTYDNKTISFAANKRYAYVSAHREDTRGAMDIYKIYFNEIKPNYTVVSGIIKVGDTVQAEKLTVAPENITITVYRQPQEELYGRYSVEQESGEFVVALLPGKYKLQVKGEAFETYTTTLKISDNYKEKRERKMNIVLERKDNS